MRGVPFEGGRGSPGLKHGARELTRISNGVEELWRPAQQRGTTATRKSPAAARGARQLPRMIYWPLSSRTHPLVWDVFLDAAIGPTLVWLTSQLLMLSLQAWDQGYRCVQAAAVWIVKAI